MCLKDVWLWQVIHYLMNLKIKQICNAIKEVQLSQSTVTRRVEYMSTLNNHWGKILKFVNFFSLQLGELTDVCDASQLLVFIQMVFNYGKIKEKLLKTIPLYGKTRGEDIGLTTK